MNRDIFTGGIEQGGLTTDYEIRMLVCWVLHQLKESVTLTQLNDALQQDGLVNYFELVCAVGHLVASGHLMEGGESENKALRVTELGRRTAMTFERNIPLTVREKALSAIRKSLLRERLERENRVEIERTSDGYRVQLTIPDVGADLLDLSMYVPTQALCEEMKRRFLHDPTVLYRAVIEALTGEELDASPQDGDLPM